MSDKIQVGGGGIGLGGMLFIVFLVLKLTGVIAWSWWWVTAPLWIPLAIFLVILLAAVVIGVIVAAVNS
jgi:hypothetical protein